MPIKFKISDDGRLVVEQWSGAIGHEEAVQFERELLKDRRFAREAVVYSDSRLAQFPESTPESIGEIAALHGDPENVVAIKRSAILTVIIDTFDQAQIYRDACARFGVEIQLFTETQPACEWLGVDVGTVEALMREIENTPS